MSQRKKYKYLKPPKSRKKAKALRSFGRFGKLSTFNRRHLSPSRGSRFVQRRLFGDRHTGSEPVFNLIKEARRRAEEGRCDSALSFLTRAFKASGESGGSSEAHLFIAKEFVAKKCLRK